MRQLTRYLARTAGAGALLATLVLLGLYTGIDLVREAGDLQRDYGVPEMLVYIMRTVPTRLYDVFPFAALIGVLFGLGRLAAGRELVAMRTAGLDRTGIAFRTVGAALGLAVVVMLIGELLVPKLELAARVDRERDRVGSVGMTYGQGLWLRDDQRMVRIGMALWNPTGRADLADLQFYELDESLEPQSLVRSGAGHHDGQAWVLEDVRRLDLVSGSVDVLPELRIESRLDPDVFEALATRPRLLAIVDILRIRDYLERNVLDASAYDEALWRRVLYPLNLLAMLLIGLPLLFRPGRMVAPAVNVFAGVALGIGFVVFQRLALGLAPVLPVPVGLTHAVPALLGITVGYWLLRRA